uniref:tRNA pseudouridine(38/39) synthase-like n=1 Tax=Saccoglossus kowalevskii TaxID=10224 RepID=A0ABM0MUW5_SACKO|nr:PREDICTED: tRNA pseudouridine(38/39) synthase-like [Saccoglossus kowalevskii]
MEDEVDRTCGSSKITLDRRQDLLACSKEELIDHISVLQSQITALKGYQATAADGNCRLKPIKTKKKPRPFDFTKYNTRHVALKIAYLGWDYQGFASQDNEKNNTIEAMLFDAFQKTRLIENRQSSCYSRCGRTDKGVSAFSQVISIDLRTNLLDGTDAFSFPLIICLGDKSTEIRYVHILNKVLPDEIRVLAWTPVDPDFDARFSARSRTYKYFFPKGDLNIELMQIAAQKLVGEHDYRNFCKMDVANGVVNFVRKILRIDIVSLDDGENGFQMHEITIKGQAFLYHQVRCIMAILFLIGQCKEKSTVIDELLDITENPCKPQYPMASELPLVLYDCQYENINWIYEQEDQELNIEHLQKRWTSQIIK